MPLDPASAALPTRRNLLTGLAALATALPVARALGQEASPVSDGVEELLFVQVAESGSAEPLSDEPDSYRLTLANGSGHTLYFSDRPERVAGILETSAFIENYLAQSAEPPNAALVFRPEDAEGEMKVAVLELSAPVFDAGSGSISYQARMLDAGADGSLAASDPSQAVGTLPSSFGEATLFIDAYHTPSLKPVSPDIVITRSAHGP